MNLHLSKKEKKVLLFGTVLILLLLLLLYLNFIQPLLSEVQSKTKQLESNQQLYQSILSQKTVEEDTVVENSQYLQKRLPVQPLTNQFILDLEKAETISNSLILQMNFESGKTEENTTAGDVSLTEQPEGATSQASTPEGESPIPLPTGIEKLKVNLVIQSKSYFGLETFLETIENLDRIVTIESISFSGNPEITSLEQANQTLTYQVSLSLYYMPGLGDLQNELPKVDSGEPGNKSNPLTQFDDLTENEGE